MNIRAAQDFINENLQQLCEAVLVWQSTGVLCKHEELFQSLVLKLETDSHSAYAVAENLVKQLPSGRLLTQHDNSRNIPRG